MFNIFYLVVKKFRQGLFLKEFVMYGRFKFILCCLVLMLSATKSYAWSFEEYWQTLKQNVNDTWSCGSLSAYVPVYAWHNRLTYDQKHIDKYNENPWGFGVGKSLYEGDNWHGLYAMAFKDSNDYLETFFGYGFLKNHALNDAETFKFGYGYTLGITQRHEYKYIPVPLPLPIASLSYKNAALQAAYVPGVKNDGNVLFTWLKFDF